MTSVLTIPLRLPGLNEYIKAERSHRTQAAKLKEETEYNISLFIRQQLRKVQHNRVHISYQWIEESCKRDKDNIAFAKKFINDALVTCGVLPNDGWKNLVSFDDTFRHSKESCVIVTITEIEE